MLPFISCTLLLIAVIFSPNNVEATPALRFQALLESEIKSPAEVPERVLLKTKERHVLFVPGLGNEFVYRMSGYFQSGRNLIRKEYQGTTKRLRPSSWAAVPANAEPLQKIILNSFHKYKKPLLLIAHSKGGAEVLFTVLKYPHLMLGGIVDRVILIQPAIGGSDCVSNPNPTHTLRQHAAVVMRGALRLTSSLRSLEREVSKQAFTALLEEFRSNHSLSVQHHLSQRVFYVRSCKHNLSTSWGVFFAQMVALGSPAVSEASCESKVCRQEPHHCIGHDGILRTEDQLLEGFGVDLGILKADHADLVVDGWLTRSSTDFRKIFFRTLMRFVLDYEPAPFSKL